MEPGAAGANLSSPHVCPRLPAPEDACEGLRLKGAVDVFLFTQAPDTAIRKQAQVLLGGKSFYGCKAVMGAV